MFFLLERNVQLVFQRLIKSIRSIFAAPSNYELRPVVARSARTSTQRRVPTPRRP